MAAWPIFQVLLVAVITKCNCELTSGFNHNNRRASSHFGELLKPPPPPPLSNIIPVPFHGGASRSQRQSADGGYIYQPPPPPPPPPIPSSNDFKFPAPFYKQYNFNFVPPPQPFTTTPSPSLFQKFSGWLFNSQQTSYNSGGSVYSSNSIAPAKKDCNPCNLVPWIPVIRYDLGAKNVQHNLIPTYGPPSPTAYANSHNVGQYRPQPFHVQNQEQKLPQLLPGVPHTVYGPPGQSQFNSNGAPSSTYGPPSPTHTIPVSPGSTYSSDSNYAITSSSHGVAGNSIGQPSSHYGLPSSTHGVPSSSYGVPSSTYGAPTTTYATPSPAYETPRPVVTSFETVTPDYEPGVLNNELPQQSDVDVFQDFEPVSELQLPKVRHPSGFKNSYGEPITNTYSLDIPYSVSATAAESTKINSEVLPNDSKKPSTPNMSLALANPAPFTLNRGRNIHTLQPVALPNLSVSPLPPIFNARPFRPVTPQKVTPNFVQGINYMQQISNNVNIEHSVPIAEFTHSVEYPTTIIKSTLIDIDASKNLNQTKAYRNIPNGYILEGIRDISSQASEDHVSATKSNHDSSFESTGADFGNDLYDNGIPSDLKFKSQIPSNHKGSFADLRGEKDEDVDKYRSESNLQNIDSPLLYLKPSAPHKDYENFVLAVTTPMNNHDYEIYDDIPTTAIPPQPTLTSWDESRTDHSEGLVPPPEASEDSKKPKIVQIIVPYTTGKKKEESDLNYGNTPEKWTPTPEDEYQARKVPSHTENPYFNTVTENYSTGSTTTEEPIATEHYDSDRLNTQAILNDLYDVKEPPFDIIRLQHTIDDWTVQEYSKHYKTPQRTRTSVKYSKQIPDDYFTTNNPINNNYVTTTNNYNYDFFDHEGSSSNHHPVTDDKNKTVTKSRNQSNTIEITKTKYGTGKNEEPDKVKKPYVYTAASSFRSMTTPAPWGKIQTSISPLTKEKVYVVTSKPWRETSPERDKTNQWYAVEPFESKKTNVDTDMSGSDNLPFKSPRFSNRPPYGFTASENSQPLKSDSSYVFSKSWHQSINNLETQAQNNSTSLPPGLKSNATANRYAKEDNVPNMDELHEAVAQAYSGDNRLKAKQDEFDTISTTTAEPLESEKTTSA